MTTPPSRLARFLLNPWFAGATTVVGVIAGWLGAHFDHEIAQARALVGWPGHVFSPGATIFWCATLLFAVGFASTLREQARVADRSSAALDAVSSTAEDLRRHVGEIEGKTLALVGVAGQIDTKTGVLQGQTANLERLVQRLHTLPPSGFLQEYADSGRLLVEMACSVPPGLGRPTLEALLRAQLVCVLKIVGVFDAGGSHARYGCNLMLYRPADTLDADEAARVQARLHFAEAGVQVHGLAGVLDMLPALSVSSESLAHPDPQLSILALPVPRLEPGVDPTASQVLPGAPESLLSGQPTAFESVDDLARLREDGRFSRFVVAAMQQFFARNPRIRSYACFPIFPNFPVVPAAQPAAKEDAGTRPAAFAVLNIHRDQPNRGASERLPLLNPLLMPLCAGIGALLQTLEPRSAMLALPERDSR